MYIADGKFSIHSHGDGISSVVLMQIDGGEFKIVNTADEAAADNDPSLKGIKCTGDITVSGGSFNISSEDDAIRAKDGGVSLLGGDFIIHSMDDAVKADQKLLIDSSKLYIVSADKAFNGETVSVYDSTIFALCNSGAKRPNGSFDQYYIRSDSVVIPAGSEAKLTDDDGVTAEVLTPDIECKVVFYTSPALKKGDLFTFSTPAGKVRLIAG